MEQNKTEKQPMGLKEVEAVQDAGIARVNKKVVVWSLVAIVVILVIGGIVYWVHQSGSEKANEAIGKADIEQNDSIQFAMYKKIADDGSYKANERAKLMVAIHYYQDGKYKEALEYLDKASVDSKIIETGIYSLKGDCYANLDQLDQAAKCFNKALDEADDNPQLVPFILVKLANIYRAQKKYEQEYEVYSTLRTDYPGFIYDVDKYYERARVAAGK